MDIPLRSFRIQISIALISSSLIAYQIVLVKLFCIQYWYHFAHLIVSIALLAFGASGTFLYFFQKFLKHRFSTVLFLCPLLFILFMWVNLFLNRTIAFNPLMLLWQPSEILKFLFLTMSLFTPFFFGALCISLCLATVRDRIHRIYGANLVGSGMGCALVLLTIFHFGPHDIMFIISLITAAASFFVAHTTVRKLTPVIVALILIPLYTFTLRHIPLEMSAFKDLSQALNLPGAKKELEFFGPLGLITVLDSPAYHYLPDMSLNCPYMIPPQKGLFLDGNTAGAIHHYDGNQDSLRFMSYRTGALSYILLKNPDVLIIGSGTGTEILNALYHSAQSITAVEINGDIVDLMRGFYTTYSGGIYEHPIVHTYVEEGRGYLQRTKTRFDLIQLPVVESGVYSLSENYLLTTEAFRVCFERLKSGGMIHVSLWLNYPPRAAIKMLATAIEMLAQSGERPENSLIIIRSWQMVTLTIKKGSFQPQEIAAVKRFCEERLFDVSYYPGIREEETNRFNRLERELLFEAAMCLLSPRKNHFYTTYPFHVRPATDDSPFFSHFFKTHMIKQYATSFDRAFIPFIDWGYILVWIALCILFILGIMFILIPLPFVHHPVEEKKLIPVFVYFGSLGMAYMLLEISTLQQFIRYLHDPAFSATVVIGSFLVYSGIGSFLAERIPATRKTVLIGVVLATGSACLVLLACDDWFQNIFASFPLWLRMVACSVIIAPLAIPMGIPFPTGLSELSLQREWMIPWAWSINGFFSVMGGSIAVLIAMGWGFTSVKIVALIFYALSLFTFTKLKTNEGDD